MHQEYLVQPTFLIYLTCFYLLSKWDINIILSKLVLISISVLGIYITQTIIKGTMSQDIIVSYSVTAVVVGLILRLREVKIKMQDNPATT